MEKGPKYRLIHIYNKLPSDVKNLQNINVFKKRLFALLLEINLYKLQEYFEMWTIVYVFYMEMWKLTLDDMF